MPRPRPTLFEVRYSAKPNRDNHWRIVGFKNGKRKQHWYKSEEDAKAGADDLNAEITAHGTQVSLSSFDRLRAIHVAERLRPYGKTIDDAVNFYVAYLEQLAASVPFSNLEHRSGKSSSAERRTTKQVLDTSRPCTRRSTN